MEWLQAHQLANCLLASSSVLILVLMEWLQAVGGYCWGGANYHVLILVLMEWLQAFKTKRKV